MQLYEKLEETVSFLSKKTALRPRLSVVLGSGLGFVAQYMSELAEIEYGEIPNFKISGVPGHSGKLMIGRLNGVPVMVFSGRTHLYEGYTPREVAFPVMAAVRFSARGVVLTNAAGALSPSWRPGDLMLIRDHLNFQGTNVLAGPWDARLGDRFQDLTDLYSARLRAAARRFARERKIRLREGVYAAFLGPSYETKAEVRMARSVGADAVGMSTVQEAIGARRMGAAVLGLSVVTNLAAGVTGQPLSHDEVKENAARAQADIVALVSGLMPVLNPLVQDAGA